MISVLVLSTCEKYELKRALNIILEQTMLPDEIVIIDSVNNEDSYEYIEENITSIVRYIKVDSTSKTDIYGLFRIGIKYITGDYVAFYDTKDIWHTNVIESYSNCIKESKADIITAGYTCQSSMGGAFLPSDFFGEGQASYAYIQFLDSFSSVCLKISVAINNKPNLEKIRCCTVDTIILDHQTVDFYTVDKQEKKFWNCYEEIFRDLNILYHAMRYCIRRYQRVNLDRYSFLDFADNVSLSVTDAVEILYGRPEIARIDDFERKDYLINIEKKQNNYLLMRNWVELKNKGRSIEDVLKNMNVSVIGIYGAGKHGQMLYDELKNTSIKVSIWIDSNPKTSQLYGVDVIPVSDLSRSTMEMDAIVVTPFQDFCSISDSVKRVTDCPIISLEELVKG